MAALTHADLKPIPSIYQSSRVLYEVLIGEDTALALINASDSDDASTLRNLLADPEWAKVALERPHWIYNEDRPSQDRSDVRGVTAMPYLNLGRAMIKASETGHAEAVSTLLNFASQHDINASDVIGRWVVDRSIKNGHSAVIEALSSADSDLVVNFPLGHGTLPLDVAVRWRQTEVVAVLLKCGADPQSLSSKKARSHGGSLLSLATKAQGTRMTQVLLEHGVPVSRSGALHLAATLGALDTMRLLIQHGADVNEILPGDMLGGVVNRAQAATWTPSHFAASQGKVEAMRLLETNGARTDMKDRDGKTSEQLLKESK